MKKVLSIFVVLSFMIMAPAFLSAQVSAAASGQLTVTATVDPSISMQFVSDSAGVALSSVSDPTSGTLTSASATLAFGHVNALEAFTPATGATFTPNGTTNFTISSPFDVEVLTANSTSTSYTLKANLDTADAVNTWKIDAVALTATAKTITATGNYGSTPDSHTVYLTVPNSNTAGSINQVVDFAATSN